MPGHDLPSVKCEPSSEDEDHSDSQFHHDFLNGQQANASQLRPVSLELRVHRQNNEHLLQHLQVCPREVVLEDLAIPAPAGPAATPVCVKQEPAEAATTLETLESTPRTDSGSTLLDRHLTLDVADVPHSGDFTPLLSVKDEPLSEGEQHSQSGEESAEPSTRGSPKSWTQKDMDNALTALRDHHMSLTKASAMYGIPSTTLWQRAHRLGIDTPKKEGCAKSWGEADLRRALHALRAGAISANKASKAYGIPSSTLYKIARREGIRLSAPFNATPVAWRRADLARALEAIRAGDSSVQRAAAQYGIPTGTLYGRCKREGIELSRANPTPWSEGAMGEALEAVRVGAMSINQAAIHYNLPYSSLYGRFKRCKPPAPAQGYPPSDHNPPEGQHTTQEQEPDHHQPLQETQYYHQHQPQPEDSAQHQYLHQHTGYNLETLSYNAVQDAYNLHAGAPLYFTSCHAPS